ncbi:hypothetical protein TB2_039705 [Malus domestica]
MPAEEAFQNAKKGFWTDSNGLRCDALSARLLIHRALIKEVDHEYFAPDEGEGKGKIGQTNKKAKYSDFVPLDEHNTILDDPRGRNQWHTNGDVTWERGITQGNGSAEKNAWEDSRNESRGWNQMGDSITPPKGWDTGVNPWEGG